MSFDSKLQELVAAGRVTPEQAGEMKKSMGMMPAAVTPPRKGISIALVTVAAVAGIALTGALMLGGAAPDVAPVTPQNVAETMNVAGSVGAAGSGLMGFFAVTMFVLLPLTIVLLVMAGSYNRLADADEAAKAAEGIIAAARQKRADLLPNILQAANIAVMHEQKVQMAVGAARQGSQAGAALAEAVKDAAAATALAPRLNAVMESYPDLKASANLASLQHEIAAAEHGLETARIVYNHAAAQYNTELRSVLGGVVAALAKLRDKPYTETSAPDAAPALKGETHV